MIPQAREVMRYVETNDCQRLIFDLDGTLSRLILPWPDWIEAIAAELEPTARGRLKVVMSTPGAAWGEALNEHIIRGDISPTRVIEITREFENVAFKHVPNQPLVDAAVAMAAAGRTLYLWSNNMHSTCERVLRELAIDSFFSLIVGRDDVRLGKPDSEGWQLIEATKALRNTLLIGDSDNDKRAAANAGIPYFNVQFVDLQSDSGGPVGRTTFPAATTDGYDAPATPIKDGKS